MVEGNSVIVDGFGLLSNETAGAELNKAKNDTISDIVTGTDGSNGNKIYGIWIRQSNNNQIIGNEAQFNGDAGIYVGCSASGPTGAACPGVGKSSKNLIWDNDVDQNTKYGLVIDSGDGKNIVTRNDGDDNGIKDAFDANSNCGSNLWFVDVFGAVNSN